jgi:hypothetical protein
MSVALINKWLRIDKDVYIQSEVMPSVLCQLWQNLTESL